MCGMTGFLDFRQSMDREVMESACQRMADALVHRGPDDHGVWTDASAGVALGHRRLSILDLSPLGRQPMTSASGRYVVSFNGEIYNFLELRRELAGQRFRGASDTEVMLAAFEEWGVPASLRSFNGMFALAVWDTEAHVLWLARDRFGEKPLYYGHVGHALVFGSELKAVRRFPGFAADVDRGALTQYIRFGYVPADTCILRGMRKLPPATFLRIAQEADVDAAPWPYWSIEEVAREGILHPFVGTDEDAIGELDALLHRAVALRMVSDVPLGALLSGGIDSSTIVAMMCSGTGRRVRTFTIGSDDPALDEAKSARRIAAHLGTEHTELQLHPGDALAVIPKLPLLYDEPFADPSQIPTFLVCELARRSVTVALSGDGGDELFGGYNWYAAAEARWRKVRSIPAPLSSLASALLGSGVTPAVDRAVGRALSLLPAALRARLPGNLVAKLVEAASITEFSDLFLSFQSAWSAPSAVTGATEPAHRAFQTKPPELDDVTARMMCTDLLAYLPDDILVKLDRAAMGVSLETRVPMLDPDVARFAWSLPKRLKRSHGPGKVLLRKVLSRHVPPALFDGPKKGFVVPLGAWLRGPLRDWAESHLSDERLRRDGFFEPNLVRRKWSEHLAGMRNSESAVWSVLMFQAWCAEWGGD